jgi:betaine-aldehyde dehydrogenase
MQIHDKIYINGKWVPSQSTHTIDVINAATEAVMGRVPDGTTADADAAVAAARGAFAPWSETPVEKRAGLLQKIAAGLRARGDEIAHSIAGEVGMPLKMSQRIQAGLPPSSWRVTPACARAHVRGTHRQFAVLHEAVGVIACITPWNYPLHQVVAKWRRPWQRRVHRGACRAKSRHSRRSCWLKSSIPRPAGGRVQSGVRQGGRGG